MIGRSFGVTSVLLMALLLVSSSAPSSLSVSAVDPHVECYAVSGITRNEIRENIKNGAPRERDGSWREGLYRWQLDWNWPTDFSGPNLRQSQVRLESKIVVPCLEADPARPPEIELEFSRYRAAMIRHERRHFEITRAGAESLGAALRERAADVSEANRLARESVSKIEASNREFDRETGHGTLDGVKWGPF